MDLIRRPRRLRTGETLRRMVRETRMDKSSLIYPMFVTEGEGIREEIRSMPGQYRYSVDQLGACYEALLATGVDKVMLFGIPRKKDALGSQAYAQDGIVQRAMAWTRLHYPQMYLIGDVCMCEYTSHGHCGIVCGETVDNDRSAEVLARIALTQVQAGADMVAPSAMMDGSVAAIRRLLDARHYETVPIMSYAVKIASSFYGPFRDAAGSAPKFGNRRSYQMDCHNRREALRETLTDIEEGADIVMVKPAMAYGDLIREIHDQTNIPVAAYSVSGEYAMIRQAAKAGAIDETAVMCEAAVCAYRAGAGIYLTYFAKELAACMDEGRIG